MKIRDIIPTLTGFEELAIEQATGKSFEELTFGGRDVLLARAIGAVLVARDEKIAYRAAWEKVQAMPQKQVGELFPDEDDDVEDVLDDDPITESGKDESVTGSEPMSSPLSSSSPA